MRSSSAMSAWVRIFIRTTITRLLAALQVQRLLPAEFILEVQPIAADRQRIIHATAGQTVRRAGPARRSGVAAHGRLSRAERVVVAESGGDGRRTVDRA